MPSALDAIHPLLDPQFDPWADASGGSAGLAIVLVVGCFSHQPLGFKPFTVLMESALRLVIVAAGGFFRRFEGLLGLELSAGRLSLKHVSSSSVGIVTVQAFDDGTVTSSSYSHVTCSHVIPSAARHIKAASSADCGRFGR
jgi:hypothetical protein